MDLREALYVQRGLLDGETVVIVSTLAALRVENTEGRKIYESAGALQHHFSGLSDTQVALLERAGGNGVIPCSLANVLRLRRPVVIVDEAHNARTLLSFDTLARFNPSCILEFTATPDQEKNPSNVLYHVSAAELKAEGMIKLPIELRTREQWKEAVSAAVAKQVQLERAAREEEKLTGEYIRPLVLFQAQPKSSQGQTVTPEVLKDCLLQDFNIADEQIAIATGEVRELEDVDVFSRDCPVRFIITVAALKEGWDCSFAYVLCSVANLTSGTAVEQILGRVLRLPHAGRKHDELLNHAYAFATSAGFVQAANTLTDALVEAGFERFEASAFVKPVTEEFTFEPGSLFGRQVSEPVAKKPRLEALPAGLQARVQFQPTTKMLIYQGPPMTPAETDCLQQCAASEQDKAAVRRLSLKSHGKDTWPAALGEPLAVPVLAVRVGGQLEIFEDQFVSVPWTLSDCDALLSEAEFSTTVPSGGVAEVDVSEEGRIGYRFIQEVQEQLALIDVHGPQTPAELAVWLDRAISHREITQSEASLFLLRLVESLASRRRIRFEELVAQRFRLRAAAAEKIRQYRQAAVGRAYEQMLIPEVSSYVEVSPELCFEFPLHQYPANRIYQGPMKFNKHYYEAPAAMNDEEAECALLIDSLPEVKYWVRNLDREQYSFWLQTPTDKFYPDFVARLNDGRFLAVEYKGEHLISAIDAREKKALGEMWEARSKGLCLFRMVSKKDMEFHFDSLFGRASTATGIQVKPQTGPSPRLSRP
jgi:type III restriction enzyme